MYLSVRFKPVLLLNGFINFLTQVVQDVACAAGNMDVFQMTGTRQVNFVFALYLAGAERHKNNTIAQSYRFSNIVSDKDYGAAGFRPDTFQFIMKQIACLRVERGKGLVH